MQKYWCNCGSQSCVWEGWGHGMKLHNNNIKWKFALEIITSINCLLSCDIYIPHCSILVCFGELNWLVLFLHSSLFFPTIHYIVFFFLFSSSINVLVNLSLLGNSPSMPNVQALNPNMILLSLMANLKLLMFQLMWRMMKITIWVIFLNLIMI